MNFKKDAYVKIVGVNGEYRYGYISKVTEGGWHVEICTHDEGDSKVGYDSEWDRIHGVESPDLVRELTDIERSMVCFIAQGCSPKEIGCHMRISPVTVRGHQRTLRLKLGVENQAQLVVYAQGLQNALTKQDG